MISVALNINDRWSIEMLLSCVDESTPQNCVVQAPRDQRAFEVSSELRRRLETAERELVSERSEGEALRRRLEATEVALSMVRKSCFEGKAKLKY